MSVEPCTRRLAAQSRKSGSSAGSGVGRGWLAGPPTAAACGGSPGGGGGGARSRAGAGGATWSCAAAGDTCPADASTCRGGPPAANAFPGLTPPEAWVELAAPPPTTRKLDPPSEPFAAGTAPAPAPALLPIPAGGRGGAPAEPFPACCGGAGAAAVSTALTAEVGSWICERFCRLAGSDCSVSKYRGAAARSAEAHPSSSSPG